MEVSIQYPPNYDIIITAIPAVDEDKNAIFCYGDTIYNPHNRELTQDLHIHESVHARQQKEIGIDEWWRLYLTDKQFRLEQEIQAYGEQFAYVKEVIEEADRQAKKEGKKLSAGKNNLIQIGLERMAEALSSPTYGSILSRAEAGSKIRNYGKTNKIQY